MGNDDHGGKQDQLEEHSLPGTHQAGKGPGTCEETDQENGPGLDEPQQQDQIEEHSLPGTNQAGKEASPCEENDESNRSGGGPADHDVRVRES
jgi:hypothetical protein